MKTLQKNEEQYQLNGFIENIRPGSRWRDSSMESERDG